jgi:4'-phosphopantetheinyl transferase EntD
MNEFKFEELTVHETQIYLCSYTDFNPSDHIKSLTTLEKNRFHSFKHIRRKREFIATRILRNRIVGFQHVHYDVHGAPYLEDGAFISISHSKNKVGLAVNENYKIGLDIESIRPTIKTIMHKFLSEEEKVQFDIKNTVELCKIWSAKETLYKLAGRKQIQFKSELLLNRVSDNLWIGTIINGDHDLSVKLKSIDHEHTIITTNTEAIIKKNKAS